MVTVKIKRLPHGEGIPLPEIATAHSAGFDLRAAVEETVILKPAERFAVPTGFVMEIPEGYEGQIRTRSGMALNHGIVVLNSPGTVDADYRGEVKVILANLSRSDFVIKREMRVAQMVIAKCERVEIAEAEDLTSTKRGPGGFGHTGTS